MSNLHNNYDWHVNNPHVVSQHLYQKFYVVYVWVGVLYSYIIFTRYYQYIKCVNNRKYLVLGVEVKMGTTYKEWPRRSFRKRFWKSSTDCKENIRRVVDGRVVG